MAYTYLCYDCSHSRRPAPAWSAAGRASQPSPAVAVVVPARAAEDASTYVRAVVPPLDIQCTPAINNIS